MQPRTPRHELVQIKSGAFAIRSVDAGEVMHPGVGPQREAQELYVDQSRLIARLREPGRESLVLFDVGLGAASNALAARTAAQTARGARLQIVSFEHDLDALYVASQHKLAMGIEGGNAAAIDALLATGQHRSDHVDWQLRHGDLLQQLAVETLRADLVFWDPFSPKANPTLWTIAAFSAMRQLAGPRCTLYTYSGSTRTRLALLLAGWCVGIGAAIGDKEETTAAAITLTDLERPLDRAWLHKRLAPSTPWPTDTPAAPSETIAQLETLAQFG